MCLHQNITDVIICKFDLDLYMLTILQTVNSQILHLAHMKCKAVTSYYNKSSFNLPDSARNS